MSGSQIKKFSSFEYNIFAVFGADCCLHLLQHYKIKFCIINRAVERLIFLITLIDVFFIARFIILIAR